MISINPKKYYVTKIIPIKIIPRDKPKEKSTHQFFVLKTPESDKFLLSKYLPTIKMLMIVAKTKNNEINDEFRRRRFEFGKQQQRTAD